MELNPYTLLAICETYVTLAGDFADLENYSCLAILKNTTSDLLGLNFNNFMLTDGNSRASEKTIKFVKECTIIGINFVIKFDLFFLQKVIVFLLDVTGEKPTYMWIYFTLFSLKNLMKNSKF